MQGCSCSRPRQWLQCEQLCETYQLYLFSSFSPHCFLHVCSKWITLASEVWIFNGFYVGREKKPSSSFQNEFVLCNQFQEGCANSKDSWRIRGKITKNFVSVMSTWGQILLSFTSRLPHWLQSNKMKSVGWPSSNSVNLQCFAFSFEHLRFWAAHIKEAQTLIKSPALTILVQRTALNENTVVLSLMYTKASLHHSAIHRGLRVSVNVIYAPFMVLLECQSRDWGIYLISETPKHSCCWKVLVFLKWNIEKFQFCEKFKVFRF